MTPLNNDYWAVKVPKEAREIHLSNHCIGFKYDGYWPLIDTNGWCLIEMGLGAIRRFELFSGYITKSECTVDAEKIVERLEREGVVFHPDYRINQWLEITPQESLYSLLESKGIYFVNPMGKNPSETNVECCGFWQDDGFGNPQCCHQPVPDRNSQEAEYLWRGFESHLAEKVILIRKL